jgi:hypothetical protein
MARIFSLSMLWYSEAEHSPVVISTVRCQIVSQEATANSVHMIGKAKGEVKGLIKTRVQFKKDLWGEISPIVRHVTHQ